MTPRAFLGLVFVLGCGTLVGIGIAGAPGAKSLLPRLGDHLTGHLEQREALFPTAPQLRPGDPVYLLDGQTFALVGRVVSLSAGSPARLRFSLDPMVARQLRPEALVRAMRPGHNLGWIVATLLPKPDRRRLGQELKQVWEEQHAAALQELKPRALALLGDMSRILAKTLPPILHRHQEDLQVLRKLLEDDIYPQELKPVIQQHWLPRLEQALGKEAQEMAREAVQRIRWSRVTGLFFSALLNRMHLVSQATLKRRLTALFKEAVLPVLKKRAPALARKAYEATRKTVREPDVQAALVRAAKRLFQHPRCQALLKTLSREWLLENPPLRQRLQEALHKSSLMSPVQELWKQVEHVLEHGLERMLSRDQGDAMSRELAQVLRRVVLKKDRRYLLLESTRYPWPEGAAHGLVGHVSKQL